MKIDDEIRDKKLQNDISREQSEKIDQYEYLTGEEILPPNQRRVIKEATFTYSSLGKALVKQKKNWGPR